MRFTISFFENAISGRVGELIGDNSRIKNPRELRHCHESVVAIRLRTPSGRYAYRYWDVENIDIVVEKK